MAIFWANTKAKIMQAKIEHKTGITALEAAAFGVMAVVIAVGFYLAATNDDLFRSLYIVEDGFLEYATSFMLFATAVLCSLRLVRDRAYHTKAFTLTYVLIVVLMIFGAGEEISWGQRIFNIESSEFFLSNNRQYETNLHNMEINGVNINKLIFSKGLVLFLILFYLILPWVYRRNGAVARMFDRLYIPVPKVHFGFAMLAAGLIIDLIPSGKKGELNEVCLSIFFFLTLLTPHNKPVVVRD
ncbi:hypothetical protein ASD8599_01590 [Ascidiaceihabitans donghaensis]|uniref:Uncharacterized protein n=2 Tax=Ascidiaceihabitans donghaensis TaxID=1510460 RepID=A0A2R8BD31_9RHOB|nr:hypothetical protein ASD8599_01590 [Ascidiaceihabitans donghaensis]